MVGHPFDPRDHAELSGPLAAFDPGSWSVPALQNHLALEVIDHIVEEGVEHEFRGGTGLHSKLRTRARNSTDADVDATDPAAIHRALRGFAARFPHSDVRLEEPPRDLRAQGLRGKAHLVTFGRTADGTNAPKQVLVEVVEVAEFSRLEPLPLFADGLTWPHTSQGPTLEGFMGQKLATLGPTTVGIPLGPNATMSAANRSVAKQLFDLRELGRQRLQLDQVAASYRREVALTAERRRNGVTSGTAIADARRLVAHLRGPRVPAGDDARYWLWSGYRDTSRFILDGAWSEATYRVTAGVVDRLLGHLDGPHAWDDLTRPLAASRLPPENARKLDEAFRRGEAWIPEDRFGGDLLVAWAWSPPEYW